MKGPRATYRLAISLGVIIVVASWLTFNLFQFDTWQNMHFLWALLCVPAMLAWAFIGRKQQHQQVRTAGLQLFGPAKTNFYGHLMDALFVGRVLAIALLIMAFARPQHQRDEKTQYAEGIDIVIAMDLSLSMMSKDFKQNRLDAARRTAIQFVKDRPQDRFGLVAYAGNAMTLSPLTADHLLIEQQIKSCDWRMMKEPGTAIGLGLGFAVNRLRESDAPSKVIILLTDGENNVRAYPPLSFAQTAKQFGVRVYTIGVGTRGTAMSPVDRIGTRLIYDEMEVAIDEETLQSIAELTGGAYFRATNEKKLESIYREIDKLEKSRVETFVFADPEEHFSFFVWFALALLGLELLLRQTLLKSAVR